MLKISLPPPRTICWRLSTFPIISHLEITEATLNFTVSLYSERSDLTLPGVAQALQPFYVWRLTEVEHNFSFSMVTALVNMSAGFLLPKIFSSNNSPSSKSEQMKWYRKSICFVLAWNTGFLARCIALWLSLKRTLFFCFKPNSSKKPFNQIISLVASVTATYSTSVVDNVTIFYKRETQLTAVEPKV